MADINYSIIIPHKNIPDLLQRCLNSIPRRKDIQIIVVDDNSDPDKVDFEHFPGLGEKCVEVYFTKEGKGAGYARNVGLKHAKGKWLLFADADDFFCNNLLDKIDTYLNSDSDIIYFKLADEKAYACVPQESRSLVDLKRANTFNLVLSKKKNIVALDHIVPYSKIIKTEIVKKNGLFFDEVPRSNDVMFFTKLAFLVHHIEISTNYLYCVSFPQNHNITSKMNFRSGKSCLQVILARNQLLQEHGLKNMITPPLMIIWEFRKSGLFSIFRYILIVLRSSTSLFTGISKFLRRPLFYLKK